MQRILFEVLMYGMCFIPAIGISYLAGVSKKRNRKSQAIILSLFVILIVCLFAGIRKDTVGTDIRVYAKPVFEGVGQYSLKELSSFRPEVDYGFCLLYTSRCV